MTTKQAIRSYLRDYRTPEEWEEIVEMPTFADEVTEDCEQTMGIEITHWIEVQAVAKELLAKAAACGVKVIH